MKADGGWKVSKADDRLTCFATDLGTIIVHLWEYFMDYSSISVGNACALSSHACRTQALLVPAASHKNKMYSGIVEIGTDSCRRSSP